MKSVAGSESGDAGNDGAQAQARGTVIALDGKAETLCVLDNLDIQRQPLARGDQVFFQQVVETMPGASVTVRWDDGSIQTIGSDARAELVPPAAGDRTEFADAGFETDAIEELQAALDEGLDPSALAPTAAGAVDFAANDDGTDFVIISRGNASDPYQSFDTPGYDTAGIDDADDDLDVSIVAEPLLPANDAPAPVDLPDITVSQWQPPQVQSSLEVADLRVTGEKGFFITSASPSIAKYIPVELQIQDSDDDWYNALSVYSNADDYAIFELHLSEPSGEPVTVNYEILTEKAVFSDLGLSVSFAAGEQDAVVAVPYGESGQVTLQLSLDNTSLATLQDTQVTATEY